MRHTRGHTNNRRSHHALSETKALKDAKSGALRLPHHIDETTGMYRGNQIVAVKAKKVSTKAKGPVEKVAVEPVHLPAQAGDHAHEHANAEAKSSKGILGKITGGGRPKARSGMGGQAS
jgi:large subunit ribosomal protein L32